MHSVNEKRNCSMIDEDEKLRKSIQKAFPGIEDAEADFIKEAIKRGSHL